MNPISKPKKFKDLSKIRAELWFDELFYSLRYKLYKDKGQKYNQHGFTNDNGLWFIKLDATGFYNKLIISRVSAISETFIEEFNLTETETKSIIKKVILSYYSSFKISSIELKKTKTLNGKIIPIFYETN